MVREIDPITLQVIRSALRSAAGEMQLSLMKTAHNPLIYEIQDFGVALTNAGGEAIAEGSGLPGFLGCLPRTVSAGIELLGTENFAAGDILLSNAPYDTGTHISDTAVYMPIFHEDRLVAFSAIMAHWADIGGTVPGGWSPHTTDVHQEGMIFPHLKLWKGGQLNGALQRFILANVRFPDLVEGDLNAMIAACRTGERRYRRLCERYGAEVLDKAMQIVFDKSERRMRREIENVPDGTYSAGTMMDHDGVELDKPIRMRVKVTIDGDCLHIDWTGTDAATKGPVNHPGPGTEAICAVAIKSLLMPLDPMNQGHVRPIKITAPRNTVVHPLYPAACDSYGYVGEMILHLIVRALSKAIPDRCPACSYQMCSANFRRTDPRAGTPFICYQPVDGGGGALPFDDGPSGLIFVGDGDAPNLPAEAAESRYPLRITRYAINTDGAGAGKFRAGFGVVRDYEMLENDILLRTSNENTLYPPWGLFCGGQAGISTIVVWEGTDRQQVLTGRVAGLGPLNRGDRVSVRTAGGGGWGDPKERDPSRVRQDLLNELISPAEAEAVYGIKVESAAAENENS